MPKITNPDGSTQHLCKLVPTPFDLIARRFLPLPQSMVRAHQNRYELRCTGYDRQMDVPYLSGCFMFLRAAALRDVGVFDERFFMYPEAIDLTRRIHANWRTVFNPAVSVIHDHGKESYKSWRMLWIHMRSMIRYFNKWGWLLDGQRRRFNRETLAALAQRPPQS